MPSRTRWRAAAGGVDGSVRNDEGYLIAKMWSNVKLNGILPVSRIWPDLLIQLSCT
jgi:hypothetical protein